MNFAANSGVDGFLTFKSANLSPRVVVASRSCKTEGTLKAFCYHRIMIQRAGLDRAQLNAIVPEAVLEDFIERHTMVFVQHRFAGAQGEDSVHALGECQMHRTGDMLILQDVRNRKNEWRVKLADFTLTQMDANGIELSNERDRYAAFVPTDAFMSEWRRFSGT